MTQAITLARPYARAAFEVAHAQHALGEWSQTLAFAAQVADDPQVRALFGRSAGRAADFRDAVPAGGRGRRFGVRQFVRLLAEHRRLALLPEMAELFEQYKRESESRAEVQVRSAAPFDAPETARSARP